MEDEGLADNTVLFFWGDHGRPMVRGKQFLYEGGIWVPLIIRWPGKIEQGTVCDDLVSTIDLVPTWLSIAGVDVPDHMQGDDLLNPNRPKRKYIFAARDRCDETDDRIRCVRTKRYKYIRNFFPERPYIYFNCYKKLSYPVLTLMKILHEQGKLTPEQAHFMAPTRPKEELFDLQVDPHEVHNLADEPKHQKILHELCGELDKWIKETGDQGEIPEDEKVVAYWDDVFEENYANRMKARGLSVNTPSEEYLAWWERELAQMRA